MTRREAREIIFSLVYEADFHRDGSFAAIYNEAIEDRAFEENDYVRGKYVGTFPQITYLNTIELLFISSCSTHNSLSISGATSLFARIRKRVKFLLFVSIPSASTFIP